MKKHNTKHELYVIQSCLIGRWIDVQIVSNEEEGRMVLKICAHARRKYRLVKRTEEIVSE